MGTDIYLKSEREAEMTREEMTDAELLKRFNATGDEDAFRVLVEKYLGLVFGVALRRTGQHFHAEEIAQNVFIVLARKASRLKPTPSLSPWLYRCTLIEVAELGRRNRAHERKMKAFGEQVEPTGGRDVWNEVLPLLDESIHSLPATDCAVILLRFFEQKSFREIGRAFGKSEDAAQKQCERALQKLGRILTRKGAVVPATVLSAGLAAHLAQAVPAGLSCTISTAALAGVPILTAKMAILESIKFMIHTKTNTAIAVAIAAAIPLALQWRENHRLHAQLLSMSQRRAVEAEPMGTRQLPAATNTIVVDWRMVDSPNYRAYIANMKAVGVPWETIKDIIIADVNKLYAQKAQSFLPRQKYWQTLRHGAEKERMEKLSRIDDERKLVLQALLGVPSDTDAAQTGFVIAPSGPQLDFLTAEKRAQIETLGRYDILRNEVFNRTSGSPRLKEDLDELKKLETDKRNALAAILTPDELEQYDLVTHPIAETLRRDLGAFSPTADEFRQIFAIRRTESEEVDRLQREAQLNPNTPGYGLRMAAVSEEAEKQLASELGADRYGDYKRSQDLQFQLFERVGERVGLSDAAVLQAWQIKKTSEDSMEKLAGALGQPPTPQELSALKANFISIEQKEEQSLRMTLGNDGFAYYKSLGPIEDLQTPGMR